MGDNMIEKECAICSKVVQIKNCREKTFKTCSRKCSIELKRKTAKTNRSRINCLICGKEMILKKSCADKRKTCSWECSKKHRSIKMSGDGNHQFGLKGSLNSSWKSDRRISNYGYVLVRHEDSTRGDGFILEHNLVMQQHIGRKLTKHEVVHHINRDKTDNRIENLELMTRSDHSRIHIKETLQK